MSANGELLRLHAGEYAATIASAGATLVSLTHGGRDLVATFDPTREVGRGFEGRTLMPWPNRIADGRYTHGGRAFQVSVNEPETGCALHGLVAWVPWAVQEATERRVRLALDMPMQPGYLFDLELWATFELDDQRGLTVELGGRNVGPDPAPFGISSHPYLTCAGAPLDDCELSLPAAQVLLVDDNMVPTDLVGVTGDLDCRAQRPLAGRRIDHAFSGLPDGGWRCELRHPDLAVALESDEPWVQLYSGEKLDRRALAVEPMTCPPDAFNGPDADVTLEPGAQRALMFRIALA